MDDLRMDREDDFRVNFREEMQALRTDLQKDKLNCDIDTHRDFSRERRDQEFHEKEVDFHRNLRTNRRTEDKSISSEYDEGGNLYE
jgi:hypothetical protein